MDYLSFYLLKTTIFFFKVISSFSSNYSWSTLDTATQGWDEGSSKTHPITFTKHNIADFFLGAPIWQKNRIFQIISEGKILSKWILGAINLHTPLWPCSESIARIDRNQKPVFLVQRPDFCSKTRFGKIMKFCDRWFSGRSGSTHRHHHSIRRQILHRYSVSHVYRTLPERDRSQSWSVARYGLVFAYFGAGIKKYHYIPDVTFFWKPLHIQAEWKVFANCRMKTTFGSQKVKFISSKYLCENEIFLVR